MWSSYDSHSKHIILIGSIHILCYIFLVWGPATTGVIFLTSNETMILLNLFSLGYYFLMTIFSGLMILGVKKQRHVLIAPWLILACLGLVAMIAIFFINFFVETDIFISLSYFVETIGMEILVIYPAYTYYMKLRPKSLKQDSIDTIAEAKNKTTTAHVLV